MAAALLAAAPVVKAQNYPIKPVRLVYASGRWYVAALVADSPASTGKPAMNTRWRTPGWPAAPSLATTPPYECAQTTTSSGSQNGTRKLTPS